MPKVRVAGFGVSLDGFSAGTEQSLNDPLGKRGPEIFQWFFHTKTFCAMHGQEGGSIDVDDEFARRLMENFGAFIIGRNMFGPVRGPWPDSSWKGWWGDNPPFHTPTYVLTHRPHPSLEMEGGTTFHFLDAAPADALEVARDAAAGQDVRIGGGPTMMRAFIAAGLVDHLHVVQVPILLGRGARLWDGLEGVEERYNLEAVSSPSGVTHLTFTRR